MMTSRLPGIQMLRGIAAGAVALYHAGAIYTTITHQLWYTNIFRCGYLGVDIFFIISGFIIYLIHADDLGRPDRLRSFLVKRSFRIMPAYWAVLLGKLAIKPWAEYSILTILYSIILLPIPKPIFINVSWTLSFELLFYLIFGTFIASKWLGWAGLAALLALFLASVQLLPSESALYKLSSFYLTGHPVNFVLGVLAAKLYRADRLLLTPNAARVIAFASGAVIIASIVSLTVATNSVGYQMGIGAVELATSFKQPAAYYSLLWFSIPATLLVLASCYIQFDEASVSFRGLMFFGEISYSFYLVHAFVIFYAMKIGSYQQLVTAAPIAMLTSIIAGAAVAYALYRFVEKPSMRLGQVLNARLDDRR